MGEVDAGENFVKLAGDAGEDTLRAENIWADMSEQARASVEGMLDNGTLTSENIGKILGESVGEDATTVKEQLSTINNLADPGTAGELKDLFADGDFSKAAQQAGAALEGPDSDEARNAANQLDDASESGKNGKLKNAINKDSSYYERAKAWLKEFPLKGLMIGAAAVALWIALDPLNLLKKLLNLSGDALKKLGQLLAGAATFLAKTAGGFFSGIGHDIGKLVLIIVGCAIGAGVLALAIWLTIHFVKKKKKGS